MKPTRPRGGNFVFGADQAGVRPLVVRREIGDFGLQNVAEFEPSAEELAVLNAGGRVELVIVGSGWPPVSLGVVSGGDDKR